MLKGEYRKKGFGDEWLKAVGNAAGSTVSTHAAQLLDHSLHLDSDEREGLCG
jgi:hypothetical protein